MYADMMDTIAFVKNADPEVGQAMERELQRRGLTYTARRFTLEFGQPFLSLDDAQAFFRLYSRDGAVPSRQELAQRLELKNGRIMWPVRTALSGKAVTPGGAVEICHILGRDEALRRIRRGIEQLGG